MTYHLSNKGIQQYQQDGFLFPLQVLDTVENQGYRHQLETLEQRYAMGGLPRPFNQYLRANANLVIPFLNELAANPHVLDPVESILGPNILLWGAEVFTKEAQSKKVVSWHQDLTYWGLGETDQEITAWLALSPATLESGCMCFVAGSHHRQLLPHKDTFDDNNLLSRGQQLTIDVDEFQSSAVILQPGQMSLHHGRMFHSSGPNRSDDRRIGIAMRFITPAVTPTHVTQDYAVLMRGENTSKHWHCVTPPAQPFAPESLTLYDSVLAGQSLALADGSETELQFN